MTDVRVRKIALGTAQFGSHYGIANQRGKIPADEVFALLRWAGEQGIGTLDTARAYGDSEAVIGAALRKGAGSFKIISKLPQIPPGADVKAFVREQSDTSMAALNAAVLEGYLVHAAGDLLKHEALWSAMEELKSSGKVRKIGVSLYRPQELSSLWDKGINPDIVQIPFSVFDRRFEPLLPELNKRGVEVHARSVFLHGLALMEENRIPERLSAARPVVRRLAQKARLRGVTPQALCLHAAVAEKNIARVVIGVDSLEQIKENLVILAKTALEGFNAEEREELKIVQEDILLPFLWKI